MRTALVTGAARGIGQRVAQDLAKSGLQVVLGVRDASAGQAVADAIEAVGGQALVETLDVGSSASIDELSRRLSSRDLAVDVLVHNAGVLFKEGLLSGSDEQLDETLRVNFLGPARLSRRLLPGMVSRGYGRVVHVTSSYASIQRGFSGPGIYTLSKAAVNLLTIQLASEVPPSVKINSADPGWVRSDMGGASAPRSLEEGADTITWLATLPDSGPTGQCFCDRNQIAW